MIERYYFKFVCSSVRNKLNAVKVGLGFRFDGPWTMSRGIRLIQDHCRRWRFLHHWERWYFVAAALHALFTSAQ
jgi:hypothetical protein